ncbi:MAG: hypothetical protein ACM65K_18705 [Microcoleus sp.]
MLLAFVNIRGVTTEIHTRSNFILLSFVVLSFAKIAVLTRGRSPIGFHVTPRLCTRSQLAKTTVVKW